MCRTQLIVIDDLSKYILRAFVWFQCIDGFINCHWRFLCFRHLYDSWTVFVSHWGLQIFKRGRFFYGTVFLSFLFKKFCFKIGIHTNSFDFRILRPVSISIQFCINRMMLIPIHTSKRPHQSGESVFFLLKSPSQCALHNLQPALCNV